MGQDKIESRARQDASKARGKSSVNPFDKVKMGVDRGVFAEVPNLGQVIDAVLDSGAAVLFGRTGDGGAIFVQILDGKDRYRTYPVTQEQLEVTVNALWERFKSD